MVLNKATENIFRIKNVLDAVISVAALATILAIVLVLALSPRLWQWAGSGRLSHHYASKCHKS